MHTHTVGHVDRHGENVAVHPCTQTDKVAIAAGFRPINFPPHSFIACIFFFFFWVGFYLGAAGVESIFSGPGTAWTSPTVHWFSHEKLVF